MRNLVALAILLVTTFHAKVHTQDYVESSESNHENIWALSRRSLKVESAEIPLPTSSETQQQQPNENQDYESFYSKTNNRPVIQRFARYRFVPVNNPEQQQQISKQQQQQSTDFNDGGRARYVSITQDGYLADELADYDFDAAGSDQEESDFESYEDDVREYRHGKGKKDKKKKKKKKKKGGGEEEEVDPHKKYIPPFWFGKQRPGWGTGHVEQVGFIIPNNVSPGGWKVLPSSATSGDQGVTSGDLKWVDGKGWTGKVGAPWRAQPPQEWGPGYNWVKKEDDEDGGKKGKKGKKKKDKKDKKGKKDKKKKKKKGKKKKKKTSDPCEEERSERGGKKKGKGGKKNKKNKKGGGGGGWGKECKDKGPKPWFGWPQKIKFIPPPPRGSQIWLKTSYAPPPVKSGWSDYHGWNWKSKLTSGWGVSDLVGVVHL